MPTSFKTKDALINLGSKKPFGVNDNGVDLFVCLRLLCGTVDLEDKSSGRVIKQRYCHLSETKRVLKKNSLKDIVGLAFGSDISMEDIEKYLNYSRRNNVTFWNRVLGELCLAVSCHYDGGPTKSFLHIYRLLEMTSVALPLFYASAEHNYEKALLFLKGLPENPRDGDLAIMRKFIKTVSSEGGYRRHVIAVPYSKGDASWDRKYENQIQSYIIDNERLNSTIDSGAKILNVPFEEFPSFHVSFRNRLFHNTLSKDNFNLDDLLGSDRVCEPIIKPAFNWFTLVLCVIIQQNISRYV